MKKILIVEDEEMLSEIYQRKFSSAGFDVIIAPNGKHALEQIDLNPDLNLILLDLVMPEEDGFEVLKKIKQNPKTQNLRVVIFSNLSQEDDRQRALTLGAEGFIIKSDFTPQEIVNKVNGFLGDETGVEVSAGEVDFKKKRISNDFSQNNVKNIEAGGKKILMIEDEEVFTEVFGKKLQEMGYSVDIATNGAWGLKKLSQNQYDLLILDIVMPALDGFEVIDKIESGEENKGIPIIVFSNSVDEIDKEQELLDKGVSAFLVKTRITPSELADKVKEIIG